MMAMEKQQAAGGELAEAERAKSVEAVMGKPCLSNREGQGLKEPACFAKSFDGTLAKENGISEVELVNRAVAIPIIGSGKPAECTFYIEAQPDTTFSSQS